MHVHMWQLIQMAWCHVSYNDNMNSHHRKIKMISNFLNQLFLFNLSNWGVWFTRNWWKFYIIYELAVKKEGSKKLSHVWSHQGLLLTSGCKTVKKSWSVMRSSLQEKKSPQSSTERKVVSTKCGYGVHTRSGLTQGQSFLQGCKVHAILMIITTEVHFVRQEWERWVGVGKGVLSIPSYTVELKCCGHSEHKWSVAWSARCFVRVLKKMRYTSGQQQQKSIPKPILRQPQWSFFDNDNNW